MKTTYWEIERWEKSKTWNHYCMGKFTARNTKAVLKKLRKEWGEDHKFRAVRVVVTITAEKW